MELIIAGTNTLHSGTGHAGVEKADDNGTLTISGTGTGTLEAYGLSLIHILPALVMPLIIIGGILSGVFTATEAGAIAGAYGLIIGIFVYKEFTDVYKRQGRHQ